MVRMQATRRFNRGHAPNDEKIRIGDVFEATEQEARERQANGQAVSLDALETMPTPLGNERSSGGLTLGKVPPSSVSPQDQASRARTVTTFGAGEKKVKSPAKNKMRDGRKNKGE